VSSLPGQRHIQARVQQARRRCLPVELGRSSWAAVAAEASFGARRLVKPMPLLGAPVGEGREIQFRANGLP